MDASMKTFLGATFILPCFRSGIDIEVGYVPHESSHLEVRDHDVFLKVHFPPDMQTHGRFVKSLKHTQEFTEDPRWRNPERESRAD